MDRKHWVWALVVLGVALFAVSALADQIGLGDKDGIGLRQSVGMLLGAAAVVAGIWLMRRHAGIAPPQTEI